MVTPPPEGERQWWEKGSREAPPADASQWNAMLDKSRLPGGENPVVQGCEPSTSSNRSIIPLALPSSVSESAMSDLTPKDENAHKYVGLVNQAMTCYLNSLLQTLYMTPEFRNAIYEWEYRAGGNDERSIPCQLQKLFLLLQTSDVDSLETKDLTNSFGWSSNEAYDQHDVQELCRLMFDALEIRWKGTRHEKLIEQLYRGTMQDFVKCLNCGKESLKEDVFLDLPLAVKNFGATQAFKSVEEALEAFVKPERLDGHNQYMCDNCHSKQDADKGLRITSFPYLLTIQLKRFDFDYNTFNRIKLNDRVSFPDLLDLNSFVSVEQREMGEAVDGKAQITSNEKENKRMDVEMEESGGWGEPSAKKVRVGHPLNRDEAERLLQKGQFVYELFSVMVHQGSAAGGHYYAYIKNLDQGKWYCFNDTRVEVASPEEVERSFGGPAGGWSSSNNNAYMLMYRQVDKKRNCKFISTPDLPTHIKNLKERWREMEERKEERRKYEESLLTCNIRLNLPRRRADVVLDVAFTLTKSRDNSLSDVLNDAVKHYEELLSKYKLTLGKKNCRLVRVVRDSMVAAFISPNDLKAKVGEFVNVNMPYMRDVDLWVDVKPNDAITHMPVRRDKRSTVLRVHLVDIREKRVDAEYCIPVYDDYTILKVKEYLGSLLSEKDFKAYRVAVEKSANDFTFLDCPEDTPVFAFTAYKWFVDAGYKSREVIADRLVSAQNNNYQSTELFKIIDRYKFGMNLLIEVPSPEELASYVKEQEESDYNSEEEEGEASEVAREEEEGKSTEGHAITAPTCSTSTAHVEPRVEGKKQEQLSWAAITQRVPSSGVAAASQDEVMSTVSSTHSDDVDVDASAHSSFTNNTPVMSPNVSDTEERGPDHPSIFPEYSILTEKMSSLSEDVACTSNAAASSMVAEEPSVLAPSTTDTSCATLVPSEAPSAYDIAVTNTQHNMLTINIDKRAKVVTLREWLSARYGVDSSLFSFYVAYSPDGQTYDSSHKDDDSVDSFRTVNRVVMKLRPALKDDEKMIKVRRFDLEEQDLEKMKLLFEIPATRSTTVGKMKKKCLRQLRDKYQEKNLSLQQLRLRCFKSKRAELRDEDQLSERGAVHSTWSDDLYLFSIPEDRCASGIDTKGCVLVRRFRPSTVELDAVDFIFVPFRVPDQRRALKEEISAKSHIPIERIDFHEPHVDWSRWPYSRQRVDLLENWRSHDYGDMATDILDRIGQKIIYYRDRDEQSKVLSEEDKKLIRIKDQNQLSAPRRRERALRIQMNSVSEP